MQNLVATGASHFFSSPYNGTSKNTPAAASRPAARNFASPRRRFTCNGWVSGLAKRWSGKKPTVHRHIVSTYAAMTMVSFQTQAGSLHYNHNYLIYMDIDLTFRPGMMFLLDKLQFPDANKKGASDFRPRRV
jgi:hypothetical protein